MQRNVQFWCPILDLFGVLWSSKCWYRLHETHIFIENECLVQARAIFDSRHALLGTLRNWAFPEAQRPAQKRCYLALWRRFGGLPVSQEAILHGIYQCFERSAKRVDFVVRCMAQCSVWQYCEENEWTFKKPCKLQWKSTSSLFYPKFDKKLKNEKNIRKWVLIRYLRS